jgi:hypothetical protein
MTVEDRPQAARCKGKNFACAPTKVDYIDPPSPQRMEREAEGTATTVVGGEFKFFKRK